MSLLEKEPFGTVDSMEELFAIAAAMEQVAIDGYSALAARMRRENQPDLAAVFDRLVAEESTHLANVDHWSKAVLGKAPDDTTAGWDPGTSFDDEGADQIAPELLSAYRAFSIAVRNEERAFAFWTYLAAKAGSDALRAACEQMAREELGHVATLRRERRRAFHAQGSPRNRWTTIALEQRLTELLSDSAAKPGTDWMAVHADAARQRSRDLLHLPLSASPLPLAHIPAGAGDRMLPCAELLLDCYLDLAERLPSQDDRDRALAFAAQVLSTLQAIRSAAPVGRAPG